MHVSSGFTAFRTSLTEQHWLAGGVQRVRKFNPCTQMHISSGFTEFYTCFNEQNWLEGEVKRVRKIQSL